MFIDDFSFESLGLLDLLEARIAINVFYCFSPQILGKHPEYLFFITVNPR